MAQKPFRPRKGQVDFTNVRWCPVVNCVLRYRGKILLVKRSRDMRLYPNYWNGVSGFLDDEKSLVEKVHEELREELGMKASDIRKVTLGRILNQEAPGYKKTWIVHPVLVDVKTDTVRLDWEAEDHRWVAPEAALKMRLMPGFRETLRASGALS